jgi:hypothetical protein
MEKEFVTYEQALALKELGFNEECFGYYVITTLLITTDNVYNSKEIPVIKAPLKQQVFRWFREKYELYYRISGVKQSQYHYSIDYQYKDGKWGMMAGDVTTYEEAENACIDKLIEIAKQQDK